MANYDALAVEEEIIAFWKKNKIFEKSKKKIKGKKSYYLLQLL